ncbi:MAG: RNA polymerase sigma factor [Alphaproteobacteria bacterium]
MTVLSFALVGRTPDPMRGGRPTQERNFEEIVQRFEIPLLQYARRITGNREQARDVVQETFVKFQRNGALRREEEPATWLFTVCRNAALNVCRKERRIMYLDEELLESRESEQPMPFDQLEQREATGFLLRIVATLPARQGEVIQLKFQNDLSYQQIADVMQTTANNVGVLLHTALKTLRERYAEIAGDFIPFKPRITDPK